MIGHHLYKTRICYFALLAICLTPLIVQGQEPEDKGKKEVPFDGTQAFQRLLYLAKLQPLQSLEEINDYDPKDTVIVVFGNTEPLFKISKATDTIQEYQRNGGSILIASDRHFRMPSRFSFGIRVSGESIAPLWRGDFFLNSESCPLLNKFRDKNHPLLAGVSQLATNQPSWIELDGFLDRWQVLSVALVQRRFPFENGIRQNIPPIMLLASVPEEEGRVVLLPGHGVFMNGMMVLNEDNFRFADNTVRWLSNDGQRKYVLFYHEGKLQKQLDVPLTIPPTLPIPTAEMINKLLRGLENENFFNKLLLSYVSKSRLLQYFFLSALIILIVLAGLRIVHWMRASKLTSGAFIRLFGRLLTNKQQEKPVVIQRRNQIVQSNLFSEPARMVAKQWLDTIFGNETAKHQRPKVQSQGWLQRSYWRRKMTEIWQVATGRKAIRSRKEFRTFLDLLQTADEQIRSGELKIT